jgi:hypothetical protein
MQEQQVEAVHTQLAGTFVERVQRRLVAVVADPDFGLDEHVIARDARLAHPFSDLPLIGVRRRRVDEPITVSNRRFHGGARPFRRALKYAEAEGGHLHTVVQREEWTRAHHLVLPAVAFRTEAETVTNVAVSPILDFSTKPPQSRYA